VRVASGTLYLFHSGPGVGQGFSDTGVNSGVYEIAGGATLIVSDHAMDGSSAVRGAGTMEFRGNTNTVKGAYDVSGQTRARGNLAFQSGATVGNVGQLLNIDFNGVASFDTGGPILLHDVVVGGTLAGADRVTVDGTISGAGSISAADVVAAGNISPGNSPGKLTVSGELAMQSSSTLTIELARTAADLLATMGGLTVDGNLAVGLLDGYVPGPSDRFTIATSGGPIVGLFDDVLPGERLATLDGSGSFVVNYGAASALGSANVVLSDFRVPEPAAPFILLAAATPGLFCRRGRRHPSWRSAVR
jgi:hypothetical protein